MKIEHKKEYNQISKKELIENDKILIINKFGFASFFKKTNTIQNKKNKLLYSNITQSSFKSQKNIKINKKNILTKSHSNLLLTHKKDGRNYTQYKPSLTNASTNTNLYSSFYNSKNMLNINQKTINTNNINKREQNLINSCLWNKLIKHINQNQNAKINLIKNNHIYNNNTNNSNNDSNSLDKTKTIKENEKNISKYRIKNVIKIQNSTPIKLKEIKPNDDTEIKNSNSDLDKSLKSNNNNNNNILDEFTDSEKEKNNIAIKNKNFLNENKNTNINNNIFHKGEKFLCKFLSRNNIYDISSKDIKEEKSLIKFFYQEKESDYLFISEIEKNNKKIANLNLKKFINLSDKCIYNILSSYPEIYCELINSNIYIKKRIKQCLDNMFKKSIDDFKIKYKDFLQVMKYDFFQNKIKSFNCDNNYILDLILYCRIITKETKLSIEISCNYYSNKDKYDYVWILDIQKKSSIKKWVSSEINTSYNIQKNQAISYTSQVSSFSYLDEIRIPINIFNINNVIDQGILEWCEPVIYYIEPAFYEKTKYVNNLIYDPLRSCEIEMQILFWSIYPNEKQKIIINEVKKVMGKYFEIKNIWATTCKYDFYKMLMKPNKTGLLTKNKFFNFDINIIDEEQPLQNEIQCIYFLNMNSFYKKMDIRIGSDFIFYIIDMNII